MKHTKGPWMVGKGYSVRGDNRIIFMQGATKTHGEASANAKLIAAAPELLEACNAAAASILGALEEDPVKDWKESLVDALDCLNGAINKAEDK